MIKKTNGYICNFYVEQLKAKGGKYESAHY